MYIWIYRECSLCRLIRRPQHLIGRHCGISRQTEGHSLGDHVISESVSITPSSVIEASIVLCSVSSWLVQSAWALDTRYITPVYESSTHKNKSFPASYLSLDRNTQWCYEFIQCFCKYGRYEGSWSDVQLPHECPEWDSSPLSLRHFSFTSELSVYFECCSMLQNVSYHKTCRRIKKARNKSRARNG
jgi:hypothetical protein